MIKCVRIEFINYHEINTECSAFYSVETTTNAQALIEAINLFTEQCKQNNRNFEIISASIDND